jgi:hypothetical protein
MFLSISASVVTHRALTLREAQQEVYNAFKGAFLFWGAIPIWLFLICYVIVWSRKKYHG